MHVFQSSQPQHSPCVRERGNPSFLRVPAQFVREDGFDGPRLFVSPPPATDVGLLTEATDSQPRGVFSLLTNSVVVESRPLLIARSSVLSLFVQGDGVEETFQLNATSVAFGAGMSPPSAPFIDAGVYGSLSGCAPGTEDPLPVPSFPVAGAEPALEWRTASWCRMSSSTGS